MIGGMNNLSKYEFLTQLEEQLKGFVSNQEVRESVNYYQEYIEEQIRMGQTEEAVLSQLGSANGIAKSIIDAKGRDAEGQNIYDDDAYTSENDYGRSGNGSGSYGQGQNPSTKIFAADGWKSTLILVGIILLVLMIVIFAFKVFVALMPIIIPFVLITFAIKLIKRMK